MEEAGHLGGADALRPLLQWLRPQVPLPPLRVRRGRDGLSHRGRYRDGSGAEHQGIP